jgi:hypothetical protein
MSDTYILVIYDRIFYFCNFFGTCIWLEKKHNKFPDGSVMVSDQTGLKFHGHKVIPAQLQTIDNRKIKNTRVPARTGFGLS